MSHTNEQITESIKNNQYETLSELLNVIKEMISNGSDLNATNEQIIVAKYKLSNIKELYQRLNSESSNDDIKQTVYKSVSSNQNEKQIKVELTEDKFDNSIIPSTKRLGMTLSITVGVLMAFDKNANGGLLFAVGGIMATFGLCILLEGMSTIIKLLRKISEK